MNKIKIHLLQPTVILSFIVLFFVVFSCNTEPKKEVIEKHIVTKNIKGEVPEYFNLRPDVEKAFGYTHAVKIGNIIIISGAVSMDDKGNPTAKGDLAQQMKNCYSDLDKILKHFNCTFDDVVNENIFTTNMPEFLKQASYRNTIYKKQFPAGSWLGVKELALPEFMIEIELEVHKVEMTETISETH